MSIVSGPPICLPAQCVRRIHLDQYAAGPSARANVDNPKPGEATRPIDIQTGSAEFARLVVVRFWPATPRSRDTGNPLPFTDNWAGWLRGDLAYIRAGHPGQILESDLSGTGATHSYAALYWAQGNFSKEMLLRNRTMSRRPQYSGRPAGSSAHRITWLSRKIVDKPATRSALALIDCCSAVRRIRTTAKFTPCSRTSAAVTFATASLLPADALEGLSGFLAIEEPTGGGIPLRPGSALRVSGLASAADFAATEVVAGVLRHV